MHIFAGEVQAALRIPLVHIVDPTAEAIEAAGLSTIGLLGTAYTMEHDFFKERLAGFGINTIVPEKSDRELCNRVIFEELVRGIATQHAKMVYRGIIDRLVKKGAQGIVLGCTELMTIVSKDDSPAPIFDTMMLHSRAAVRLALDTRGR
jgi:amino-acid racemase